MISMSPKNVTELKEVPLLEIYPPRKHTALGWIALLLITTQQKTR